MKSQPQFRSGPSPASQPTVENIARRIRALRQERGWSLADVEKISKGSLKAVVLGSYERCDRTLSINRLIELANIFSVPLGFLLAPLEKSAPIATHATLMVDLRRAETLLKNHVGAMDNVLQTLSTFVGWIATRRSDWNGEVMSLREGDLAILALMSSLREGDLLEWLVQNRLLITELNQP